MTNSGLCKITNTCLWIDDNKKEEKIIFFVILGRKNNLC